MGTSVRLSILMAVILLTACTGTSGNDDSAPANTSSDVPEATAEPTTTTAGVLLKYQNADRPDLEVAPHSSYSDPPQAIIETYFQFVEAQTYAFGAPAPDPTYGPWLELTTSDHREPLIEKMEEWQTKNLVKEFPEDITEFSNSPRLQPGQYQETEGQRVGLEDCYVDASLIVNTTTGELLKEEPETFSYLVVMLFTDGRWKVDGVELIERYEGVSECPDLQS